MSYVAIIAGAGKLPVRFIEELKAQQKKVLLLAIKGITPKSLEQKADLTYWAHLTQLGKARKICLKHQVKQILMGGLIKHNRIFATSLFFTDWLTIKALLSTKDRRANSICLKIIEVFKDKGIEFMDTTTLLKRYLAPKNLFPMDRLSKSLREDIDFGLKIAHELGRLDIGQTVIVKKQTIVAVEAMEGTDQCLQRAGDVAGEGCVMIKIPKPDQDSRFDVPVVGINTIQKLIKIKAAALAIAANKTLIIDSEVSELAKKHHLPIVTVEV